MQIRRKLTYQFISIVALILLFSTVSIYFFSSDYREDDFYNRLLQKATNTAKLLIEIEEVDVQLLRRIERDNPLSLPREKIIIYNYKNEILYSNDEDLTIQVDEDLMNEVRLQREIRFRQDEYEVIGFLFADQYDRFVVIAGAVDIYGMKKLTNLRNVLFFVFGFGIILVLISGWIYSGRALKPISKVIHQVDNISVTSLDRRVDEGNKKDEIAKLAATFNNMLERMESGFKVQKNFIANASHELRTPLTAITGQLEVLLMKDRSIEEYKQVMDSILEDMKSLNHTSNRLLLLAQANSGTAESNFKPVRLDEIIWQARMELMKRHENYNINVTIDAEIDNEEKFIVIGSDQLLKTSAVNLMENGCKYSTDHSVTVAIKSTIEHLKIEFSDQGIGIEESDLKHIFEPFHRGKNAISIKGNGIGLSLVKRITDLHGGRIVVNSTVGKGSTFTLSFPYQF